MNADEVARAFAAARAGDFAPSSNLAEHGPPLAPLLAPYLDDPDEPVRAQAVALLGTIGGPQALPPLLQACGDASAGIRERAARALYGKYSGAEVAAAPGAARALIEAVSEGGPPAAALLLLGHAAGDDAGAALRSVQAGPARSTKLDPWGPVVPVALPAAIALSRRGDAAARAALWETIAAGDAAALRFLLAVLREIDEPSLLHAIANRALADISPTGSGAPSGFPSRRRLCDDAVNAFAARLDLPLTFTLRDVEPYSDAELEETRRRIRESIPQ